MIKVYFNDRLQLQKDIINILDDAEISIIREDGFSSTEQILRERFESTISFTGLAYAYVCSLIKENPCVIINVKLVFSCDLEFFGTMSLPKMEFTIGVKKCICKVGLKDNSFSAYLRDYLNTDVSLYNTKTKNCELIATVQQNFLMPDTPSTPGNSTQIFAFDVLDVFNYMISYYSDNRFSVVSDYLTSNLFAITTGFNMHSASGTTVSGVFPTLTFQKLFDELRKKLRLYMGVEYDVTGNPYLRIEQEEFFFADVELFSIDELPANTVQTYDVKRNFNQIDIGSEIDEVQDGQPVTYPQRAYTAWNKEFFGGCGTCIGDKDSKLDLVSDFIIDSNIIYEAILWSPASEYPNDEEIFLFEYFINGAGLNEGLVTLDAVSSDYYYNASITNDNVLANWIDYYGKCLEIQRNAKYGFLVQQSDYTITIPPGGVCKDDHIEFDTTLYDNMSAITAGTYVGYVSPCGGVISDSLTQFTAQEVGNYNFHAQMQNLLQTSGSITLNGITFSLHILVFTDDTYGVPIMDFSDSALIQFPTVQYTNLSLETGNIALAVGNVVVCYFIAEQTDFVGTSQVFLADYVTFELISDDTACITLNNENQNSRPYITVCDYQICPENYKAWQLNKSAYISVAGTKQWAKEIKYKHLKKSTLTLIGNDLLCGC